MALSLNINLCLQSGCTSLTFTETTGAYDAETNEGGYGTPNPNTGDATNAKLTVTAPDGTEYEIDLLATGDFPTTNPDLEYSINLANLGGRTSIEDGLWQFTYKVTANGANTVTKSYYFHCNAQCCVEALLNTIDITADLNDVANNRKYDNYTRVRTLLSSLKNAANCANETQFNKIKTLISRLCRNTNCKTCN